jgi:hypothetical protein
VSLFPFTTQVTTAMASSTEHQKHEIDCYLSIKDRLDTMWSFKGIPVKMKTPISNILDRLSSSPAMSFTATRCGDPWSSLITDIPLMVGGEDAGTFGHPNIEKILEKSQPSPFGKGDKTVMDLEYRNGREVVAKDIVIGPPTRMQGPSVRALYKLIEDHISVSMFVGKPIKIELYKLALYGKEGHFDWHRDSTHGNNHHATVLIALNTEWKGGNLGLRHEGNTVDVDMHPVMCAPADEEEDEDGNEEDDEDEGAESNGDKHEDGDGEKSKTSEPKPSLLGFQVIAFYTDIEHKVENITDGTRIVLQFDVNVKDYDDSDFHLGSSDKDFLDTLKPIFPLTGTEAKRDAIIEELAMELKKLHTSASSVPEVVLPLRHLYRLASIKPEYLKGMDGYLYEALKKTFEISLKPIVLIQETDYEGSWSMDTVTVFGFPFSSKHEERDDRPVKKRKIEQNSQIHVPALCELMTIGQTEYIEHTGNEAQLGAERYFGGGMFVAAKLTEVK